MSIREKLAREGKGVYTASDLKALSVAELVACILRSEELGREIAEHFRTPAALARADLIDLTHVTGVSWGRAEQLKAAFELVARSQVESSEGHPVVSTPRDVYALLADRYRGLKKEIFLAICLSTRNRVLRIETVSEGSLNASIVHPREVFRPAILAAAANIVVSHNHPSGDPEPSEDDLGITRRLKATGEMVGISLLDHVIVGGEKYLSLKEEGHI